MLNRSEIKILQEKKSYNKILDILYEYYSELFKKIVLSKDIEVREKDTLVDYIQYIQRDMPEYKGASMIISSDFFDQDEDFSNEDRVESLLEELEYWESIK